MATPADNKLASWPRDARRALVAAAALWIVPLLVIAVMVAINPRRRTVTLDSYHFAAAQWWAGNDLYVGPSGMNYLPHFAVLFSPFHWLPLWAGEVLWRLCAGATLAGGLWLLMRALFQSAPERPFFWATLVAMPLTMTSLRNGNANAILGGVILLAIVALLGSRWWLAAAWMALATMIKPLGIVLLMLAPLVFQPMRWRLPIAILGLLVFPFLFASPAYVWQQHHGAWTNLQACAVVSEHRFADLNGLLRTFGTPLGPAVSQVVRVAAGALTAALFILGARRLRGPLPCLWLHALTTSYLMLFNPMNEENSYGILSPALAAWTAYLLFAPDAAGARKQGWLILAMSLSMALLPNIVRPLFQNHFALFWHPFMTIVFLAVLLLLIQRRALPAGELRAQPA